MTRKELAKKIAEDHGTSYRLTYSWLCAVCESLADAISTEPYVKITNLGTFERRRRAPRRRFHPVTRELLIIPERDEIVFVPGKRLGKAIKTGVRLCDVDIESDDEDVQEPVADLSNGND